jgi:hypothetical protein
MDDIQETDPSNYEFHSQWIHIVKFYFLYRVIQISSTLF